MKSSFIWKTVLIKNFFRLLIVIPFTILSYAFGKVETTSSTEYGDGWGLLHSEVLNDDTIPHDIGDTVAIYTSGLDTTYITYAEVIPDSLLEDLWVINDPYKQMIIELSKQDRNVNDGLIGINLTDFFEPNKANSVTIPNYDVVPDPWQAISALAPKTIRIFSGASAKFMHPLGSYDPVEDIIYGGYGYNWKEMITYFDMTDGVINGPMDGPDYHYLDIAGQLGDPDCIGCGSWGEINLMKRFQEFYEKCLDQPLIDGTDLATQDLYINQFIGLVKFIEYENTGHVVDVIYCVNIESQTASEVLDVIDHLIDTGINVVGIELGNEVAGKFGEKAMGFENFERYWRYITGGNYIGLGGDYSNTDLLAVLPSSVESDHNFIDAIKLNADYWDIKIGLPAMNTPNCGASYDFALFPPSGSDEAEYIFGGSTPVITEPDPELEDEDCDCDYSDWNIDMTDYYDEISTLSTYEHYKFDAIVFHPYYTTTNTTLDCEENSNWRDIMLNLHEDFDAGDLSTTLIDIYQIPTTEWNYVDGVGDPSTDSRLISAFYQITGIPAASLAPGNFKEFTRDRIDLSFEEHANWMLFTNTDDGPESKEVWLTEYNLDDKVNLPPGPNRDDNIDRFQPFESSVSNSFSHAVMLQNWFLWNVKSNYDPDYRSGFLTRATIQNALGGSATMMMTNSDRADQVELVEITGCGTTEVSPYFLRRATYFAVELWRVILDNDLRYLKTETTMASLNDNLAPTVFLDDDALDPKLFIFYTNVTTSDQWYGIDPGLVVEIFEEDGFEAILSTDIDALILDADQLYSTAGKSPLFDINEEYNTCTDAIDNENRFELTGLEPYSPNVSCPGPFIGGAPNGVCVELPAVSMGYFVIPITISPLRKGNPNDIYSIYPNPASTHFTIQQKNIENANGAIMEIEIYNMFGGLIQESYTSIGSTVDISQLPVGAYNILIKTKGFPNETETLIKMK